MSASAFNLSHDVALIEDSEENLASNRYAVGKEEYFNSLLYNWIFFDIIPKLNK